MSHQSRNSALDLGRHGGDGVIADQSRANVAAAVAQIEALGRKATALNLDTG
uniref:3-oxoacyl-ACP reductase n=1 Tax=Xanthobacter autotrophicus TaxID=280 RepID=A0A168S4J9_XANAU|nr:3-oxoacyl-ACP reductase [Xanthobacter autotrophicus]